MDRQTLVLDSEVVAFVAAPGTDAITRTWFQQRIIMLPWPEPDFGSFWAGKMLIGSESQFDHARFLSYEARPKWLAQLL
jgi:hypothetical protein